MTCLSQEIGNFIRNITRFYFDFHWKQEGVIGCVINDPLAVAYCIDHSLCKGFSAYTTVETAGKSLGQTVVDTYDFWKKEKNSHILTETDPYRFMTFFITHVFGADASDVRHVLRPNHQMSTFHIGNGRYIRNHIVFLVSTKRVLQIFIFLPFAMSILLWVVAKEVLL